MSENSLTHEQALGLGTAGESRFAARMRRWRLSTIEPTRGRRYTRERQGLRALIREWHKRAGLFAFVFMGWLGFSGILLNQSVSLGLDASRVDWSWLLGMYGLHAEAPKSGYFAGSHWLVPTLEKTVVDGKPLEQTIPMPLGLVAADQFGEELLYAAAADRIVIMSAAGELIEQISDFNLPLAPIRRIGTVTGSENALVAIQDLDVFVTADGIVWEPLPVGAEVSWSQAALLPDEVRAAVLPHSNPSIAWEQVLIDLHSGRLFGRVGPWVINAVGLAAIILSVSGIWMIVLANRRRRRTGNA